MRIWQIEQVSLKLESEWCDGVSLSYVWGEGVPEPGAEQLKAWAPMGEG